MTLRKITQMYIAIYVLAYTKLWIIYGKCNVKFQKLNIQTNTNVGISMSKENFQILWSKKVPKYTNIVNKKVSNISKYYEQKKFQILWT
jgi:hypothetical protein